ncbi:DNA repair protein RecO [Methylocystis sp. 9N]|uniref:DNA repair protein RecO n=1 Tax=Methylocystis borbori TaxID=3118750 RepID=A0ABU7XE55_9HYPH
MDWRDDGLVIGARRHGETSVILELMTRAHGRHLGLVRGGRSRTLRPILQPGNLVVAHWRARLEDHLGAYTVEPLAARAAHFLDRAAALHGVGALCALLRLLPERDPHEELYEMADAVVARLGDPGAAAPLMARFELALLGALGFGLDLDCCALTGARDDLAYVSPKSGRAVSRAAGAPWREKLLPYPNFLQDDALAPPCADIVAAFRLTGYFLTRDVFAPRGVPLPAARDLYIGAFSRAA